MSFLATRFSLPPERRRAARFDSFANGRSRIIDRQMSYRCDILDLSETGAQLEFENSFIMPERFALFFEECELEVQCQLIWARDRYCGVAFTSVHYLANVSQLNWPNPAYANSFPANLDADDPMPDRISRFH